MAEDDEEAGFTVVCEGFQENEANIAVAALCAAGIDGQLIESESADFIRSGIANDRWDVIVPAGQASEAMAIVGIVPEPEPEPYHPSPLIAVMPLIWIGALVLAAAIIMPAISVIRGNGLTDAGWGGAAIAAIVGLIMVLGPLLSNLPKRDPKPAAPRRSRIVS